MELSECSCVGLSKARLTGRKLFPCLVVMEYTSAIPAQGKVVLSFALTFPGGFLNPDIVPLNVLPPLCFVFFRMSSGVTVLRKVARVSLASLLCALLAVGGGPRRHPGSVAEKKVLRERVFPRWRREL